MLQIRGRLQDTIVVRSAARDGRRIDVRPIPYVDELTGKKVLDPSSIPADIHIRKAEYVGQYAIRFDWSDGHESGIYAFRFLRELAEDPRLAPGITITQPPSSGDEKPG